MFSLIETTKGNGLNPFEELRNFLNVNGHARVFHSQGFFIRPKLDDEKKLVAARLNDSYISLGNIVTRADTHGLFNHPSNIGMQAIADKFWDTMEPAVKQIVENYQS